MPYSVSQVLGSNPDSLATASSDAEASASRVDAQLEGGRAHFARLADDWTGTASAAAQKQGGELLEDQAAYRDKLRRVAGVLSSGGAELGELRSRLQGAVNDAEQWWNVDDDGSVTPGWALAAYAALSVVNELQVKALQLQIQSVIKLLLAQFEAADRAPAYELRKIGWE